MKVLRVFLQPGPAHGVDDGQRAILASGDWIASPYVFEIKFLVDGYHLCMQPPLPSPPGRGEVGETIRVLQPRLTSYGRLPNTLAGSEFPHCVHRAAAPGPFQFSKCWRWLPGEKKSARILDEPSALDIPVQ